MFKKLASIAVVLTSLLFVANDAAASTTFDTRITQVYSNRTQILIKLASGSSGENCTDNSLVIIDKAASANWPQMLQLALAAYLSGKPVQVRIAGCNYYPSLWYIWMR